MTPQRPTFTQRGGDGAGFVLASGGTGPPAVTLNFDFTTGVLPGAIAFTRASIGTYTNNAGTLITATNDVARFNKAGATLCLLIEPAATNLLTQSNAFSNAVWQKANVTANAAQFVSPDGANNGWSLVSSGTGNAPVFQNITYSNIPYTISCWGKLIVGTDNLQFLMHSFHSNAIPTSVTLARLSFTTTVDAGADDAFVYAASTATGNSIGVYGMQLETGSVLTSYIPTTTTAATRSADSAVFTIPSGVGHLTYTFDDNTTQLVTVSAGSYTIPVTLNRPNIKSIVGSA